MDIRQGRNSQALPTSPAAAPRAQTTCASCPGTTKLHWLEENLGAADVALTADDRARIEQALATIQVQGDRYPASHQRFVNR